MGSVAPGSFDVKRVAIIGAGPCGLSAAKYLVAQDHFESVVVYEKNPEVGGVWYYSRQPTQKLHVPQTSPFCPPDPPIQPSDGTGTPVFPSPMYETLHTNIPHTLMKYGDKDFSEGELIFPSRAVVQQYLVEYADEVRHLIQFSTQVNTVTLRRDEGGRDRWDVKTERLLDGQKAKTTFDAIVVASGHYATTFLPEVPGIQAFHAAHPGVITHAKTYRVPEDFAGQRVVVVGNAASGLDIATQISPHSSTLLLSVHEPTDAGQLQRTGAEEVPAIEEFLVDQRGVRFTDGRVERNLDAILYCTGYLFAFPFLETTLTPGLVSDGRRVFGLYKHLFHIDHPTLVFPGLPIKVIPFPVSEAQAAVFARVWANALALPSTRDMAQWEADEARRRGRAFHVFPPGGDSALLDEFHAWVTGASTPTQAQGQAKGKVPPVWDDDQRWQRTVYAEAKLEFENTGRKAKSLEELGFRYQPPSQVGDAAQPDIA